MFVPGVLAYKVVAQPAGQPGFVSLKDGVLTQFGMAWRYHTIGLLAHNDHAGESFFFLREGMLVALVYRDGRVAYYRVGEVKHMRALSPNSPTSSFLDLDHPGKKLTVLEVFKRIYAPGQRLVFQTCIEAEGNLSWGRLFVTAYPADDASLTQFPVQPPG